MEEADNQSKKLNSEENQRNLFSQLSHNFLFLVILVASLLLASLAGLFLGKNSAEKIVVKDDKQMQSDSPVDTSLFQNPMFTDWAGKIKGKVQKTSANSITLSSVVEEFQSTGKTVIKDSDNKNSTVIVVDSGLTTIKSFSQSTQQEGNLSLQQVNKDSILDGRVRISYGDPTGNFTLVGESLYIRTP